MNDRDARIVRKILAYCEQIEETHRFFHEDQEQFLDERFGFVYRNSVAMPILQIGELAKQLSAEFRAESRAIPWRAVAGMRDIFAHHYGAVDPLELWNSSHGDIAEMKNTLEKYLAGGEEK